MGNVGLESIGIRLHHHSSWSEGALSIGWPFLGDRIDIAMLHLIASFGVRIKDAFFLL